MKMVFMVYFSSALYGIIFGTLMALGLIIIVVMCSIKCYKSGNRKVNSDG